MSGFALGDIAAQLGGELIGDPTLRIDRIGPLDGATPSTLSHLTNPRYTPQLATTQAGCVLVSPALRDAAAARGAAIVLDDPYLGFARLTRWWAAQTRPAVAVGVHASAVIDPSVQIGVGVSVGPLAVIEANVTIGDGARIGAHCFVGAGAVIGTDSRLEPHVVFAAGCTIGARGILHSGCVIGADGFGFAPTQGRWEKIEQLGFVRIGDDVEVGANTCIDRGALDDTVIGDGVKIDNQVQIGHNCRIGDHTIIAGCTGIAGSANIGAHCAFGGASMIIGHITIVDHVTISAASVVLRPIGKAGTYSGIFPLDDNAAWE